VVHRLRDLGSLDVPLPAEVVPRLRGLPVVSRAGDGLLRQHVWRLNVEVCREVPAAVVPDHAGVHRSDLASELVEHSQTQPGPAEDGFQGGKLDAAGA
jgi:hypothetical protein